MKNGYFISFSFYNTLNDKFALSNDQLATRILYILLASYSLLKAYTFDLYHGVRKARFENHMVWSKPAILWRVHS